MFEKKIVWPTHAKHWSPTGFFWNAVDTNLFRLRSTNPKKKIPAPRCFFLYIHQNNYFSQKWLNLHERCEMCWIERKYYFRYFQFLFFGLWSFCTQNIVNFRWIFSFVFHSFQNASRPIHKERYTYPTHPLTSEMAIFTWKMGNVLNQMKNNVSDFSNF